MYMLLALLPRKLYILPLPPLEFLMNLPMNVREVDTPELGKISISAM